MAKSIMKKINDLLNEEKWTRAALNSYSINNFKELDEIIELIKSQKKENEVKELCEEHLIHSKNSIIALYVGGIISLSNQLVDDSNIIILINLFSDNHKWNIVEYLCNRILEYGENKYALKTLAECYSNENKVEEKYEVWERLIKVDFEETEIIKQLAEKKEEETDIEAAIEYYKKAIHRYVNKKMFSNVKELWQKTIELTPNDIDFFYLIEKKVCTTLNEDRAAILLNTLYHEIKNNNQWEILIDILKRILTYEPKNVESRKELIRCYQENYKDHTQLEEYIRISNLNQNWRNVHDAINDFEKHIAFDTDNYVFHRSWGIGRIKEIDRDSVIINFIGKSGHKMSLKMAVNALLILNSDHIWVLKKIMDKAELKQKIKTDYSWALKTIIKSFNNVANMKKIKAELVPDVLTTGEWSKWNIEARKILKTDPAFGNLPDKRDLFVVRETPISFEEKTFNKFKAESDFFGRVQVIQDFLKEVGPDSEYFEEMFSYFVAFTKTFTNITEFVVSSYLLIQKIISVYPYLNPGLDFNFAELFLKIEDLEDLFSKINDNDIKKDFLINVKKSEKDWPEIYSKLIRLYLNKFITEELVNASKLSIIKDMFLNFLDRYREHRETFIWLSRNLSDEPWFAGLSISFEKILICMIHLLDITYREINNRRDVALNRKLNKQILDFLFNERKLINFLMITDEDSITRIYTLVEDVKELDPSLVINLKIKIKERFPNFKFLRETEIEVKSRGILVTRSGYESKQKELKHLIDVEVPQNSKDIGTAMEKGDLRENAEYKAALEKQDLLNSVASKLQEELTGAQIVDVNHINKETISFYTKVTLDNKLTNKTEEYTILGPWESEPEKNIISYLSPLGTNLMNKKKDEELKFKINEKEFHYIVKNIEKAIY